MTVSRKAVPSAPDVSLQPPSSFLPYPVTPTDTTAGPFHEDATNLSDADTTSDNEWDDEGQDRHSEGQNRRLPSVLKVGLKGNTSRPSQEALKPQSTGTNPFLNSQLTGSSTATGDESSADTWRALDYPPAPSSAPPPPPIPQAHIPPSEQFEHLTVPEPSTNPWQPALDRQATGADRQPPTLHHQASGNEIWAGASSNKPPILPKSSSADSSQPVLIDLAPESPGSPAWDEDDEPVVHEMPADDVVERQQIHEDQHAWDESVGHPIATKLDTPPDDNAQGEGWNIVDHESSAIGAQQSGVVTEDGNDISTNATAPPLPPRTSQEIPPAQPPRPIINTATNRSTFSITSPGTSSRRQKKAETYEIKRITWHDVTAEHNPRVSPILVQNSNGPCPLLALVNALTLSTPADVETALVETLRSREQVSLGLLLDAVFDELMSGRRGDAAHDLPDVSELYSFLLTLHTGMNVNPRFFPPPPTQTSTDPRRSMSHVHPSERESVLPGTFEDTKEMRLYSTFSIPIIHGWLPEPDSRTYFALERSGKSYEDAQNIMFHEEGLEDKLVHDGLSFEEQATLEDIATMKAFFASNATQLTPYGLERITQSVAPGSVAILFRNDHFSTLYRHPDTLQLLQLVTDMGYAGHEEVVWESLIDVNGENAEFFSGDFRLVGGTTATSATSAPIPIDSNNGWTPVTGRRGQSSHVENGSTSSFHDAAPPQSPTTEQEDHDLALALQLQEEEEERHRTEQARRRRESDLSQQYIEQQGQAQNIPVTQRGGGARNNGRIGPQGRGRGSGLPQEARPAIPARRNNTTTRPVDPEAGTDAPPPSYEQAATEPAYNPPVEHPSHPSASPNVSQTNVRRASAYTTNSQNLASNSPRMGRRATGPTLVEQIPGRMASGGSVDTQSSSKDKDCVVM